MSETSCFYLLRVYDRSEIKHVNIVILLHNFFEMSVVASEVLIPLGAYHNGRGVLDCFIIVFAAEDNVRPLSDVKALHFHLYLETPFLDFRVMDLHNEALLRQVIDYGGNWCRPCV